MAEQMAAAAASNAVSDVEVAGPVPIEGIPIVDELAEQGDAFEAERGELTSRAESAEVMRDRLVELIGSLGHEVVQVMRDGEWQLDVRRSQGQARTVADPGQARAQARPAVQAGPVDTSRMSPADQAKWYRDQVARGGSIRLVS